jgi:membrane-bound lytic murein transglycosylase B
VNTRVPLLVAVAGLALVACSSGRSKPNAQVVVSASAAPTLPAAPTTATPESTTSPTTAVTTVPSLSAVVATSPDSLADQLAGAERTLRDDAAGPAMVDEAGRLQQLVYRSLGSRPELADAVVALMPADLRPFVENNVAAAQAATLAAAQRPPPLPTLPAWTIREPRSLDELRGDYAEAESATGVPWHVLAAIHLVETRVGRIEGVSPSGALGPMQFLPSTWATCCTGNVLDDHDAIIGAATYLARAGAASNLRRALYRYNPSGTYVEMVSRYSENLRLDERAYRGYHAWQVFVPTSVGTVRLPVGYHATEPVDAASYLAAHPDDRA